MAFRLNPYDAERLAEKRAEEADCAEDAANEEKVCPICKGPNRDEDGEWLEHQHRPYCSKACGDKATHEMYQQMSNAEMEAIHGQASEERCEGEARERGGDDEDAA